jgi:catechol 2,3-dioxygenase-like lactoylglutathione lyase family enzyme
MKVLVNLLCEDIDAQLDFYARLLGFSEMAQQRSPIYRALDTGTTELGFNAPPARALLGLPDAPVPASPGAFATFMAETPGDVTAAAERAKALGGQVLKPPYPTYYHQWQTVLADPEGHVFRVSCMELPAGAAPGVAP